MRTSKIGKLFASLLLAGAAILSSGSGGLLMPEPAEAAYDPAVQAPPLSFGHSMSSLAAVMPDNTVKAWGGNGYYQLGNGNQTQLTTATTIPGLTGVAQITQGNYYTIYLMTNGTIKAVGNNSYGQLGFGHKSMITVPTAVPGISGVKQAVAGPGHAVLVMNDGTVKTAGTNYYGQLGLGDSVERTSFTTVPGLTNVKYAAVGFRNTVFVKNDGTVYVTGANDKGQLGINDTVSASILSPTQNTYLTGAKQIVFGGAHGGALWNDGTVSMWGNNANYELGLGDTTTRYLPVKIPSSTLSGVIQLALGSDASYALLQDSTAKVWGNDAKGQIFNAGYTLTTPSASGWVTSSCARGIKWIVPGHQGVALLTHGGYVCYSGDNTNGQASQGSVTTSTYKTGTTISTSALSYPVVPLDGPTGLAQSNNNGTSFKLSWNPVAGAVQYNVYLNGQKHNTQPIDWGTSYLVTGLSPKQTYSLTVSAIAYYNHEGTQSAALSVTMADYRPPSGGFDQNQGYDANTVDLYNGGYAGAYEPFADLPTKLNWSGVSRYQGTEKPIDIYDYGRWATDTSTTYDTPIIGSDGTLYFSRIGKITALLPDGNTKWTKTLDASNSIAGPGVIAADGTVITAARDGVYALHPADGTTNWKYAVTEGAPNTPSIGPDGTIYAAIGKVLYAINPDGTLMWSKDLNALYSATADELRAPVVGKNGFVYITTGGSAMLIALKTADGSLAWKYNLGANLYPLSPAIAEDGTLYVPVGTQIQAFTPAGSKKWERGSSGTIRNSPVIAPGGTIYVAEAGTYPKLNTYAPDGTYLKSFSEYYASKNQPVSSPAIDAFGQIYVVSQRYLYCLYPNLTIKWQYPIYGHNFPPSPVIGRDGTIYYINLSGQLVAASDKVQLPSNQSTVTDHQMTLLADSGTSVLLQFNNNYPSDIVDFGVNAGNMLRWQYAVEGSSTWTSAGVTFPAPDRATLAGLDASKSYYIRTLYKNTDGRIMVYQRMILRPATWTGQPLPAASSYPQAAAPSNLVATNVTGTGFKLDWSSVPNASGYFVYVDGGLQNATTVTGTTYTVTGLIPGKTYAVTVTALDGNGVESAHSSPLSVFTGAQAPTGLTSSNITGTGFTVSWTATAGAASYNVYLDGVKTNASPISGTGYDLTGLAGNTAYAVTVTAVSSSGVESAHSGVLNVTTTESQPTPALVITATANAASPSAITVAYSADGTVAKWLVKRGTATVYQGTAVSFTDTNLTPSTYYAYTVEAYDSGNALLGSKTASAFTKAVNPPTAGLEVESGREQTTVRMVSLNIVAASDYYAKTDLMMSFSEDAQIWSTPEAFANTKAFTLSSGAGNKTVFVRITDPAGNTTVAYDSIYYVDTASGPAVGGTPGTVGGTIGGGYPTITYNGLSNVYVVNTNKVMIDLSGSGGTYASVSTDNISFSELYPTTPPFSLYLPAGDGLKTVYAQLAAVNDRKALGGKGEIYFLVDTTAPVLTLNAYKGASATSGTSFKVQAQATDNTTPLANMQYRVGSGAWLPMPADGVITVGGFTAHSGYRTVTITIQDYAGNTSAQEINFWAI